MKNFKHFAQRYVDWVIRLGRIRFSLLGVCILAVLALCTQILVSFCVFGTIYWSDVIRSVIFGLISAPFVIYFFTLLVEKLEKSRIDLANLVSSLRTEVSERILAENKLSDALNHLEQNNRDKTALMTTISHELRTPLNGIIGLSRILLDGQLSEQQRNYLKTINVSAISLGHIFSDIIDLEKIDAQKIELNRKETDFQSFLSDITNFATLMAEQRHLRFSLEAEENLPNWLMLDNARLSQVLWNLIGNAVKFTAEGEIRLTVKRISPQTYSFSLSDTGIGIAPMELDKIFTMYYQVQSGENKPAGSGIGLAVSKIIANLMGGDLTVSSEVGKGSTFTLTLHAEEVEKPLEARNNIPLTLSILLVEDIEVNVIVAKSILEKLGYFVDVAMTGREAIEKFEHNYYDLLLLDIQLPDMSGFDIAARLRQNYENGIYDFLPPLIALTANVMQDKNEYRRKGMDDVLRKPLSLDELTHCLAEYFGEELSTPVSTFAVRDEQENDDFDVTMLAQLIEMLGVEFVKKNVLLFQQMMPDYMNELLSAYRAYQQDPKGKSAVASVAHKMKGAAASVGLKRLQLIAAEAQNDEDPEWAENIDQWINLLERNWATDTENLLQWLDGQGG
ncbi:ATP-binding protein [Caviibacterium pharyngocola]|uniref:Aerobic respiration control sensor protein n=1 Tax=Caviibacterium pharyngocola TaxID=28159 RepID=A0A2M8RVP8_9PAST|nr:ATP-binding protein [Caviibacterium pharyngocola]PJG82966.1 hybrid sensor histidine kinase/response regulator [Caviibacterium pharyngocola]